MADAPLTDWFPAKGTNPSWDEQREQWVETDRRIRLLGEGGGEVTDAGMAEVLASGGEFADEVSAKNFEAVTVTYDGENVASVTDGGATTTYTYVGDLVDTDSTVIGSTTINRQYVYDGSGNLTSIEVI